MRAKPDTTVGLIPCGTAVAWIALVVAGTTQLYFIPSQKNSPTAPAEPVVEAINVSLGDPSQPIEPPTEQIVPTVPDTPAPPPELPPIPDTPALVQIAPPPPPVVHPRVAPAPPVPAPAPPAAVKPVAAAPHPAGGATAGQPNYQPIGTGTLIGDMPDPTYPEEARDAGQQGTVVVYFTVDTNGEVTDVKVHTPCQWPILNAAAVEAIRDTWGPFQPGHKRYFEKSITYRQTGSH